MRWIVILVIVGAVLFFLMNREDESAKKPASSPSPASQASMTPAPAQPVPQQAGPARQQPPAPDPTLRLKQVAAQVGVELRGYQPQPGGALIMVAWGGDQATLGGDFLDQCSRQGVIRDFNPESKSGVEIENGRRVWIAQYSVKF